MQTQTKADISSKLNEAEVCRSMGLLSEALNVYEQIIEKNPDLDRENEDFILKNIKDIKKEIANLERIDSDGVSDKEISIFKKTLSSDRDVPAILDSAFAFKDLGLHAEAIAEYEKLFYLDCPNDVIVPQIIESLLKVHSPSTVVGKINKMFEGQKLEETDLSQIYYFFGNELEKRDHRDIALDLFKTGEELDSENDDIKKKIESLSAEYSSGSRYDYLLNNKMVTTDQLRKAVTLSKKMKKSVEYVLIEHFSILKEAIGKSFTLYYGCSFKEYNQDIPIPYELLGSLKKTFLLNDIWVPISWEKDGVEILVDDPKDLNKTDHIRALVKTKKINFSVAIKEDIDKYIKRFFDKDQQTSEPDAGGEDLDDFDLIPDVSFEEEEEEEDEYDEESESSSKVVKVVDQFLISAYRKNASDIHVEPSPITKATTIRFRMDGVCQEYLNIPNSMARGVLSRLKIMANLDIAERRLPQDGKIKFKRKGVPTFELRLATLPTAGGFEDSVLRILAKSGAMKIDEMMLSDRNLNVLKNIISRPYGLVLVVGPTGSGKTTTLHSALGEINRPGVKIWTAEDPIEITQGGLRQVEAKPKIGLDFARIMRAFLRADPDIIMIGEMRDEETASIGIEASLTGHLVFSTLHTNSAPETVTRLLDMGLNPLNFSDAFLGVLAQRLVRRLCENCKEEYHPSEEEFEEIVHEYGEEHFEKTIIEYHSDMKLFRLGSCEVCSGTGYKGRMGIHELMEGTPDIKAMIKKQASTEKLFIKAMKEGMNTLKQDGIMKVFQGHTDMAEIRRVCIV